MFRPRTYAPLAFFLALALGGCSSSTGDEGGVTTTAVGPPPSYEDWLGACDDHSDCSLPYRCACGMCSLRCGDDAACALLDPNATCALPDDPSFDGLCGQYGDPEGGQLCLLECETDATCPPSSVCDGEYCAPLCAPFETRPCQQYGRSNTGACATDDGSEHLEFCVGGVFVTSERQYTEALRRLWLTEPEDYLDAFAEYEATRPQGFCGDAVDVCDGEDNDCDGLIDNNSPTLTGCALGLGVCERPGNLDCALEPDACFPIDGSPAALAACTCSAQPGAPVGQGLCDGFDNNCDGETDEFQLTVPPAGGQVIPDAGVRWSAAGSPMWDFLAYEHPEKDAGMRRQPPTLRLVVDDEVIYNVGPGDAPADPESPRYHLRGFDPRIFTIPGVPNLAVVFYLGLSEIQCNDGIDDDLDRLIDCEDSDCQGQRGCGQVCEDGAPDNDLDGAGSCEDSECFEAQRADPMLCEGPLSVIERVCDDDVDSDGDGLIDCDDTDCCTSSACAMSMAMAPVCLPTFCEDTAVDLSLGCVGVNADGESCRGACPRVVRRALLVRGGQMGQEAKWQLVHDGPILSVDTSPAGGGALRGDVIRRWGVVPTRGTEELAFFIFIDATDPEAGGSSTSDSVSYTGISGVEELFRVEDVRMEGWASLFTATIPAQILVHIDAARTWSRVLSAELQRSTFFAALADEDAGVSLVRGNIQTFGWLQPEPFSCDAEGCENVILPLGEGPGATSSLESVSVDLLALATVAPQSALAVVGFEESDGGVSLTLDVHDFVPFVSMAPRAGYARALYLTDDAGWILHPTDEPPPLHRPLGAIRDVYLEWACAPGDHTCDRVMLAFETTREGASQDLEELHALLLRVPSDASVLEAGGDLRAEPVALEIISQSNGTGENRGVETTGAFFYTEVERDPMTPPGSEPILITRHRWSAIFMDEGTAELEVRAGSIGCDE